jgi:hypothetical protein
MGSATTWAPRMSVSRGVKLFLLTTKYILAVVHVKKPGVFSSQIKQLEQEYYHLSPSSDKIKKYMAL